ncbi:MAG: hypothetical protein HY540_02160 [Deltaproteobacteria bacterium]|nr:hypothetical protein [Deltaproteobacteria bacterium]
MSFIPHLLGVVRSQIISPVVGVAAQSAAMVQGDHVALAPPLSPAGSFRFALPTMRLFSAPLNAFRDSYRARGAEQKMHVVLGDCIAQHNAGKFDRDFIAKRFIEGYLQTVHPQLAELVVKNEEAKRSILFSACFGLEYDNNRVQLLAYCDQLSNLQRMVRLMKAQNFSDQEMGKTMVSSAGWGFLVERDEHQQMACYLDLVETNLSSVPALSRKLYLLAVLQALYKFPKWLPTSETDENSTLETRFSRIRQHFELPFRLREFGFYGERFRVTGYEANQNEGKNFNVRMHAVSTQSEQKKLFLLKNVTPAIAENESLIDEFSTQLGIPHARSRSIALETTDATLPPTWLIVEFVEHEPLAYQTSLMAGNKIIVCPAFERFIRAGLADPLHQAQLRQIGAIVALEYLLIARICRFADKGSKRSRSTFCVY